MTPIQNIEGSGISFAERLEIAGVHCVEDLLKRGANPAGRRRIATEAGLGEEQIQKWVNRADLSRIHDISGDVADLLESIGVETLSDLADRDTTMLHGLMYLVNEQEEIVDRVPTPNQIKNWIHEAQLLPRVVYGEGFEGAS